MSLEDILDRDILDRDCSKFQQGLENCLYDIKTQKYRRIIFFFRVILNHLVQSLIQISVISHLKGAGTCLLSLKTTNASAIMAILKQGYTF